MIERNIGMPADQRIDFRIGIHLGDVVEESDGDLMGDGSTSPRAWKGSPARAAIFLSEDANRQVRDKLKHEFFDLREGTEEHRPADAGLRGRDRSRKLGAPAERRGT